LRFGARLIDMDSKRVREQEGRKVEASKVEKSKVQGTGKQKSESGRRERGQEARLGATYTPHVTTVVTPRQCVYLWVFERGTRRAKYPKTLPPFCRKRGTVGHPQFVSGYAVRVDW